VQIGSVTTLNSTSWLRLAIVGALLAGLFALGFTVLQPFIVSTIWAGILSYVTWPFYLRVTRWCRGSRAVGGLLMTLLLTAALLVPTASMAVLLQSELGDAYRDIVGALSRQQGLPDALLRLPLIGGLLHDLNTRMLADPQALRATLQNLFNSSYGQITAVVGTVGRNLGKLFITVISLYFFFRDGDRLAQQIRDMLAQILGERIDAYVSAIGQTVKAVLISLVLCALAQGILAGLGYWVAGVQAPLFAAVVTTLAALIPFAVPIVWGSIVAWLFAVGQSTAAVGLLLWCVLVVSWVDNLIRPIVISNTARIPFLLVMFGVLGGLGAFGLVGMFVGPVILAVLLAVWREWRTERKVPESAG
jgi:predicted PurR-regulated permease PerM